jgi:hypothetical protein
MGLPGDSLVPHQAPATPVVPEGLRNVVSDRIQVGIEREPEMSPPMQIRIEGLGISVPVCFGESREGQVCK